MIGSIVCLLTVLFVSIFATEKVSCYTVKVNKSICTQEEFMDTFDILEGEGFDIYDVVKKEEKEEENNQIQW